MSFSATHRAVLTSVIVLVTTGITVMFAEQGDSSPAYRFPMHEKAAEVPAEISNRLDIFRRPSTAADLPPVKEASDAHSGDVTTFGANRSLARIVRTTPEGKVYLVAGASGVCFTSTSSIEEGCAPLANVLSGNSAHAVICSPYLDPAEREVYGILPNGATGVAVHFYDGTSLPVQVVNNTYIIRTTVPASLPKTVSWEDAAGRHEVTTSMPESAKSDRCAAAPGRSR